MLEHTPTNAAPSTVPPRRKGDAQMGICILLTGVTIWLALWAVWIINSTYERYRGRTDLDMPDWFAINIGLTFTVLPLVVLAGTCQLVAGGLFLSWAGRFGWPERIGFVVQWLASTAVVVLVFKSRMQ